MPNPASSISCWAVCARDRMFWDQSSSCLLAKSSMASMAVSFSRKASRASCFSWNFSSSTCPEKAIRSRRKSQLFSDSSRSATKRFNQWAMWLFEVSSSIKRCTKSVKILSLSISMAYPADRSISRARERSMRCIKLSRVST